MLTSSDSWFTTHASLSLLAATATGSSPTGRSYVRTGRGPVTSKIASRSLGVFTTSSRVPEGVSAAGWA